MRKDHFVTHIRREFDKLYCYSCHDVTYRRLLAGVDYYNRTSVVFGRIGSSARQRSDRAQTRNRSRHVRRPRRVRDGR
jgi:hypothetical protein